MNSFLGIVYLFSYIFRTFALSNASRVAHVVHQPAYRRFACRRTNLRIVGNGGKVMRVNDKDLFTKQ